FWKEYSCRFKPQLREEVLLADRQDQANQLISQLAAPGPYVWKADSEEEVIAFAVAAIRKAGSENTKFLEARTLVLDAEAPARQLSHKAGMVFLPRAGARTLSDRLAQSNATLISLGRDSRKYSSAVELARPRTDSLANALEV